MLRVSITSGCWLWTGAHYRDGYGMFRVDRRSVLAHRFAYEHLVEPIEGDLTVDHLCRIRDCVNPDHLEVVTLQENLRRRDLPIEWAA